MSLQKREKWDVLTGDDRSLLIAIVELIQGMHLSYAEFARSMHSILSDFPGREILSVEKRTIFVDQLWREYEWRRKKLDHKSRFHK